jgi:glycosyltransferase involved in cell wall biosynthesis
MRLLMTTDTAGGVWDYSMELCSELSRSNVEIYLVAFGPQPSKAQYEQAREIPLLEFECHDLKLEWMPGCESDLVKASERLLRIAKEFDPNLIHANSFSHANIDWNIPCVLVAHSCVLSWFHAVRNETAPPSYSYYASIVQDALRNADSVVFPSESIKECFEGIYGGFNSGRVILNGRSVSRFRPGKKVPLAASAGRLWDEAKNIRTLDEAASQIEWPIAVAGDCRCPIGNESNFCNLQLLGKLSLSEMSDLFSRSSIFISSAKYEPFGLAVLEAALSGCALVLSDIPTFRELWNESALFFDPDDAEDLAMQINRLVNDPVALEHFAQTALAKACRYNA